MEEFVLGPDLPSGSSSAEFASACSGGCHRGPPFPGVSTNGILRLAICGVARGRQCRLFLYVSVFCHDPFR